MRTAHDIRHRAARLKQGSSVMTRENKLAMVIGFGLLLFVGILLSDHLSARDSQIADPMTRVTYEAAKLPGLEQQEDTKLFGNKLPDAAPTSIPTPGGAPLTAEPTNLTSIGGGMTPPPAAPAAPVSNERTYTVTQGDNPGSIAKQFYGKRSLGAALAKFNNIDPSKMKIGQKFKIPDITVLDPSAAPQAAAPQQIAGMQNNAATQTPAPVDAPKFRSVTVQKGDTLWKIATRELGNGSKSKQIQDANPGLNPANLKPGASIKIALAG